MNIQSFQNALRLLLALPKDIPLPTSADSEEDGDFNLEWYASPGRVLSLSVTPNNKAAWAILTSGASSCGTFDLTQTQCPPELLVLIRQINPERPIQ